MLLWWAYKCLQLQNAADKVEQKSLKKWKWEEQKCVLLWHSLLGRGLGQRPWLPQPVPECDTEWHHGSCVSLPDNHRRWKIPNSYIKTEIMKWQAKNYTANITTISINLNMKRFPTTQIPTIDEDIFSNFLVKTRSHFTDRKEQPSSLSYAQEGNNHQVAENSPLFQMLSPCKDRGPAGQLHLLCHYIFITELLSPEF